VDIGGNLIWAYLRNTNGLAPEKLPDSSVRIDGVCVVLANSRRQFEQNILLIPAASGVHVVEAAREDPFAVPLTPIDRLFQYKPTSNIPHRVRVRGVVTSSGASRVFLQDENSGLMVRAAAAASLRVGDLAEAVGFPTAGTYSTVLEDALLRDAGPSHTPAPLDIAAGEVMSRSRDDRPALPDAMLVRVQGTLLDTSRAARDEVLVLQDGDTVFTARYLRPPRSQSLPPLTQGDRVVVTGVCVIEVSDLGAARSFELLMRSPADVRIRRPAPWFTRSVALRLSAALLAIAAGTAIWVALLRRRVRAQTEIIRHQIERESALGKRFRDLVENASDMVYTRDLEGCLIHVNQGTERLTGYTRAELLRMNFLDLLAPEERERARQQLASRTP
jgi:PAS domain-containing protein